MDNSYKFKNNKVFELAEFPQIKIGEKVVILFTGGIKSTLIALIAKKLYGIENIIFGFISMNVFGDFVDNPERVSINKKNYDDAVQRLGGIHKFELSDSDYTPHKNLHELHQKKILARFPTLKYTIGGWSKLHEESIEMLNESGYGKGLISKPQLNKYIKDNSNKYQTLNYEIETFLQPIPFTNKYLDLDTCTKTFYHNVRPFRHLDDKEIIELYNKMDLLNELHQTKSCEKSNNLNCGNCRNCFKRKDAFSKAKVTDLTNYSLN